jgi:hypothetical protein
MKKIILILSLSILSILSTPSIQAGTNAFLQYRSNDWQISTPGWWQSNEAVIAATLTSNGFTGGVGSTNTITNNRTAAWVPLTNPVTHAFVNLPTNGHLHITDEHGSTYDFLTNGTLLISNTSGSSFLITNGIELLTATNASLNFAGLNQTNWQFIDLSQTNLYGFGGFFDIFNSRHGDQLRFLVSGATDICTASNTMRFTNGGLIDTVLGSGGPVESSLLYGSLTLASNLYVTNAFSSDGGMINSDGHGNLVAPALSAITINVTTLNQKQIYSDTGAITSDGSGGLFAAAFNGDGMNITDIDPTHLFSGLAAISISGNALTASIATNLVGPATTLTNITLTGGTTNISTGFVGNGLGLTNLNATNLVDSTNVIVTGGNKIAIRGWIGGGTASLAVNNSNPRFYGWYGGGGGTAVVTEQPAETPLPGGTYGGSVANQFKFGIYNVANSESLTAVIYTNDVATGVTCTVTGSGTTNMAWGYDSTHSFTITNGTPCSVYITASTAANPSTQGVWFIQFQ